ncbi:MAG: class I SAM-dependent methyltransferase [Ruminococcus flavefaciens]|nr:class I SAM-dependent methyltransferase [Ruminococcus flavefaciens]
MHLSKSLIKKYTTEQQSARDAQRLAEYIAFSPMIFQVSRIMVEKGVLEALRNSNDGLTIDQVAAKCKLSTYAAKVLLEASLSIGTVIVNPETEKFAITKAGWFLITDKRTRVNMDFNHDVNYEGLFLLDKALEEGKPAGLKHFGDWPTVYEGLSQLPEQVQKSWFGFDHFYSDGSFGQALEIVFSRSTKHLLDVGGNTGRWASRCVAYNHDVNVTIVDLPQQLELMKKATAHVKGADRIHGYGMNLLDATAQFPSTHHWDAIWMSQFLDCFGEQEIVSILSRASKVMDNDSRLYIMETLWDRQQYETATLCLTLTSIYFTAIANGNSKMYNTDDMTRLINESGLTIEHIYDNLGQGHSIIECRLKK